jgi:hypothetical protein
MTLCIFAKSMRITYSRSVVQKHLDEVRSWSAKWRIPISSEKTAAVVFTKVNGVDVPNLKLNRAGIAYITSHHSLGVGWHHKLNWRSNCVRIRGKPLGVPRTVDSILKLGLPLHVKILLYKTYPRPAGFHLRNKSYVSVSHLANYRWICVR